MKEDTFDDLKSEKIDKKEEKKWIKREEREYKRVCRMIDKKDFKELGKWLGKYAKGKL